MYIRLLIYLIFFVSHIVRGEEILRELIRPFQEYKNETREGYPRKEYPIVRLPFEGTCSELYVYKEVLDSEEEGIRAKLYSAASYFDHIVCKDFKNRVGIDPLYNGKLGKNGSRIILLFDHNLAYPGHHSRLLTKTYERDFILLDIKGNLDSNYLRYRLPHELQHVVRYHFNENEEDWVNEGLSYLVEFMLTHEFPVGNLDVYKSFNNISLNESFRKKDADINYFYTFLYFYYLYQNFGGQGLIKQLIESPLSGIQSIEAVLNKESLSKGNLSSFYSFENSFINFQLALKLNLFKKRIASYEGMLELKLKEGYVAEEYQDYNVSSFVLPIDMNVGILPLTSKYYDINQKCIKFITDANSPILAVFVDLYNSNSKNAVRILEPDKKACVSDVIHAGQFLIIINPTTERHFFKILNAVN